MCIEADSRDSSKSRAATRVGWPPGRSAPLRSAGLLQMRHVDVLQHASDPHVDEVHPALRTQPGFGESVPRHAVDARRLILVHELRDTTAGEVEHSDIDV